MDALRHVFHGEQDPVWTITVQDGACIDHHGASADRFKIVDDLEVVQHGEMSGLVLLVRQTLQDRSSQAQKRMAR